MDKSSKYRQLEKLRHSTSHVMAQAVMRIYNDVKLGIGPAIKDGFYYDFDIPEKISENDLPEIEEEMKKIIKENQSFRNQKITRSEALKIFEKQPYKIELIKKLPEDEPINIYENGEFVDLCRGPHIRNTSQIANFKLLKVSGAYWKGKESNPMLSRIYGTVFNEKEDLEKFLKRREMAKERDHRKLGNELELFTIHPETAGPGLVFWHPRGAAVRRVIEDFWIKEHQKNEYEMVNIPHVSKSHLWSTSGHLDYYRENMFPIMDFNDGDDYILKPMNCPGHIIIYKSSIRSYRDLPVRWAEMGTVYRYEKPGVLHGLMRVRGFTQDDAHIFCRFDQMMKEIKKTLEFIVHILSTFGFHEYEIFLSTRPEKFIGKKSRWEQAETALRRGMEKAGLDYEVDEGEGVFYGPKIDVKIKDSLERMWQCSTIQVDFNIPEKFSLEYVNEKGRREQPVMIHRALFGSLERFFGILIEHYGGRFPLWLSPVQVEFIPISEKHHKYCYRLKKMMLDSGIRVNVNNKNEKLGKKIWQSRKMKTPYMAVIGDKEIDSGRVSVRKLSEGEEGTYTPEEFKNILLKEISLKK